MLSIPLKPPYTFTPGFITNDLLRATPGVLSLVGKYLSPSIFPFTKTASPVLAISIAACTSFLAVSHVSPLPELSAFSPSTKSSFAPTISLPSTSIPTVAIFLYLNIALHVAPESEVDTSYRYSPISVGIAKLAK